MSFIKWRLIYYYSFSIKFFSLSFYFSSYSSSCWIIADQTNVLKGLLPPSQNADPEPFSLTVGMTAGVSYRAWEVCGSPNDSPPDSIAYNPFLQSPVDYAKIR